MVYRIRYSIVIQNSQYVDTLCSETVDDKYAVFYPIPRLPAKGGTTPGNQHDF